MSKRNHKPTLPPYSSQDGGGHYLAAKKRAEERLRRTAYPRPQPKFEDPADVFWRWVFRKLSGG